MKITLEIQTTYKMKKTEENEYHVLRRLYERQLPEVGNLAHGVYSLPACNATLTSK